MTVGLISKVKFKVYYHNLVGFTTDWHTKSA